MEEICNIFDSRFRNHKEEEINENFQEKMEEIPIEDISVRAEDTMNV